MNRICTQKIQCNYLFIEQITLDPHAYAHIEKKKLQKKIWPLKFKYQLKSAKIHMNLMTIKC